ncbi:MAG: hypothetical protein KZQ73_02770 [Candidatus Thiodiazotropha sp. (ex Semelilucina semeliformis)]|nr:hypothetical protein [Candidatus Thiodiazotropha sp. (ex Semelilucina semeliformis)]
MSFLADFFVVNVANQLDLKPDFAMPVDTGFPPDLHFSILKSSLLTLKVPLSKQDFIFKHCEIFQCLREEGIGAPDRI